MCDKIEQTGGMGRSLAERERNANQMERTVQTTLDRVIVRQKRDSEYAHLWIHEDKTHSKKYAHVTLTPTEARKVAVALRTAASRIDSGDTGRTAR